MWSGGGAGSGVRDIIKDRNADSASLCLLGSLLFREEKDERACTQLSLGKMRERPRDRRKETEREGGERWGREGGDIFTSLVK